MLNQFYFPEVHDPVWLDQILAVGWFRMGQIVHTNEYVIFHEKIYRTIWLRHDLKNYKHSKTYNNLSKRNKHFHVEFKPLHIDETHQALFQKYRAAMSFKTSESIEDLLMWQKRQDDDVFNTYEVNLYDNGKLIACSYIDFGLKSAEGISSYYDPEYAQYSLGKYLIYLQIDICIGNKLEFYYPGYFVPSYPHLDYKLSIGTSSLEYFDYEKQTWHSINNYETQGIPLSMKNIVEAYKIF
jgi:leucyl-tRNA---protein transferase